jgi:hypothetical protein
MYDQEFKFFMKKIIFLLTACILSISLSAQTKVMKTDAGYQLMRNGKPYYVKGVGGQKNLDKAIAIGANSLRTWGIENAQQILDEAQEKGMTVMLGLWMQHERHGFDYNNKKKVKKQLDHFKSVVRQFKDHPALLMWGIGNELNLFYKNPACWDAVEELAQYIHQVDPNHPATTVTAGINKEVITEIKKRTPSIDLLCVNTYGDIVNIANVKKFGWNGAYMITEWGPNGHWESPKTKWNASIEQTSQEKKESYYTRYKKYIEPNKNYCLGNYVFLWGAKQEYTETWYGLFTKDNKVTECIDAVEMAFTGKDPRKPAPTLKDITLNNKRAKDNIHLTSENFYRANVASAIGINMKETKSLGNKAKYSWRILRESTDKKAGGDSEEAAQSVLTRIKNKKSKQIEFRAPRDPGAYRLFVSVTFNGKVAYANVPFYVDKRSESDGAARFLKFKQYDMNSFEDEL